MVALLLRQAITRLLVFGLLWSLGLFAREARAQETKASEYAVKAAFLAKFAQFVKWPSGGGSSVTVGVLGDDLFEGALDKLAKVKHSQRVDDLKGCQIVFIARSERGNIGGILSSLAGANILTVGESEGFARQGGMIGFTLEGDKVRFEINAGAARRGGLAIDPRLLQLAVRVFNS